jgi:predicted component of type VI protein secretion system
VKLSATGAERFLDEKGLRLVSAVIEPPGALVGRDPTADVCLDEPSERVSRWHCEIEPVGLDWVVRDRSTHGTAVVVRGEEPMGIPRGFPWVLQNESTLVLAGSVRLRVNIRRPPRTLGPTAGAESGLGGGVDPRPPLRDDLLDMARELTAPYRERPPRHAHKPVREIARERHLHENTVRNRCNKLAAIADVNHEMSASRRAGAGGSDLERLAAALVVIYPGLAER